MRNIFNEILIKESKKNKNIYLLTADLGYKSFEKYESIFKERFINCGVAENNMVGVATGLALKGKKVFVYSIIPFLIYRSFEQIRNNIANCNLDIKLIGAGGGFSYGVQGISHNPTEDISLINALPNIKIFTPSTKSETKSSIATLIKDKGPCYIRLGKSPDFDYKMTKNNTKIGIGQEVCKGKKVLILSTGNILSEIIKSKKLLNKYNINPSIYSFSCIKPLDSKFVQKLSIKYKYIFTVEEHSMSGGFGSSINNILSQKNNQNINIKNICLSNKVHNHIGSQNYLRKINNLHSNGIKNYIVKNVK